MSTVAQRSPKPLVWVQILTPLLQTKREHGKMSNMKTKTKELLVEKLDSYTPFDELESLHAQQLKQFLADSNNPYDRTNLTAHVVAEAWIVNPDRSQVVLVEHKLSQVWIAPGGHCDGNPDVFANALREANEETGLTDLKPLLSSSIFDLNVGPVPTRERHGIQEPIHLHFDVCFAFEAPESAPLVISDESTNLAWVPVEDIDGLKTISGHYRRPEKTLKLLF